MHAFLFIGRKTSDSEIKIKEILGIAQKNIMDYPIQKIEDVRELGKFTKLSQSSPIFIKIKDIDTATHEAQNALLKNLEEPPANINYILTAESDRGILSTILSRCKIFNVHESETENFLEATKFMSGKIFNRISTIEKIKGREEATVFIKELILYFHKLIRDHDDPASATKNLLRAQDTMDAIKKNGNVYLQLANFVVGIS